MDAAVLPQLAGPGISWADLVPDCEIFPDSTSQDQCGEPAVAVLTCTAEHRHWCPNRPRRAYRLLACAYHLDKAQQGTFSCRHCNEPLVLLEWERL